MLCFCFFFCWGGATLSGAVPFLLCLVVFCWLLFCAFLLDFIIFFDNSPLFLFFMSQVIFDVVFFFVWGGGATLTGALNGLLANCGMPRHAAACQVELVGGAPGFFQLLRHPHLGNTLTSHPHLHLLKPPGKHKYVQ